MNLSTTYLQCRQRAMESGRRWRGLGRKEDRRAAGLIPGQATAPNPLLWARHGASGVRPGREEVEGGGGGVREARERRGGEGGGGGGWVGVRPRHKPRRQTLPNQEFGVRTVSRTPDLVIKRLTPPVLQLSLCSFAPVFTALPSPSTLLLPAIPLSEC